MKQILARFYQSRIKPWLPGKALPKEPQLPLGLSRDQLEQIQALTEGAPYKHYLGALERLYETNLAAILRGLPHEAYMFQCGVCFALEQIAKLPADLTAKGKELDARHNANTSPDTASDASAALFANTPFWDAYQRLSAEHHRYGGAGVPLPRQRSDAPMGPRENGG